MSIGGVGVLQTQGDNGERYTHGEVRPRQGVARVSVCEGWGCLQTQGDSGERYTHREVRPREGVAWVSEGISRDTVKF